LGKNTIEAELSVNIVDNFNGKLALAILHCAKLFQVSVLSAKEFDSLALI